MLSVEFTVKSFFPISLEIKKTDSRRRMYFGDPCRRGVPTVRFDGVAIKMLQWNKHSQKQKGSIPDQNIQKDVKKNTKIICLDFLLNQL